MLFLFLFSCLFFLIPILVILVVREIIKVKLSVAIPTGVSTILVNEQIDTAPVSAIKTIKIWSMLSKTATYLLSLLHDFLWLISSGK